MKAKLYLIAAAGAALFSATAANAWTHTHYCNCGDSTGSTLCTSSSGGTTTTTTGGTTTSGGTTTTTTGGTTTSGGTTTTTTGGTTTSGGTTTTGGTSVPEPGMLGIMSLGLLGVGAARRRKPRA